MTKPAATPATHGTCQLCGRVQKITKTGKMARHGYAAGSLSGGGNAGTCLGSTHKPLETGAVDALDFVISCEETRLARAADGGTEAGRILARLDAYKVRRSTILALLAPAEEPAPVAPVQEVEEVEVSLDELGMAETVTEEGTPSGNRAVWRGVRLRPEPGYTDHPFSAHSLRPGECRVCGQGAGFHITP